MRRCDREREWEWEIADAVRFRWSDPLAFRAELRAGLDVDPHGFLAPGGFLVVRHLREPAPLPADGAP